MLVLYLIARSSGRALSGRGRLKRLRSVEVFICKDFPIYVQCLYKACSFSYFFIASYFFFLFSNSPKHKNSFINKIFIYIICSKLFHLDNEGEYGKTEGVGGAAQEINDRSSRSSYGEHKHHIHFQIRLKHN